MREVIAITFAIASLLWGCGNSQSSKLPIVQGDTLTLDTNYDDCGEWGGHQEQMIITRPKNTHARLLFQKDTVNCPDPMLFNRRVIVQKQKVLTRQEEQLICLHLDRLLTLSKTDFSGGHSLVCQRFSFSNYGNAEIYYCGSGGEEFEQLKGQLGIQ